MGSTGHYGITAAQAVAEELCGLEVIRQAWVGSTVYAAVRSPKDGNVFAVIVKVTRYKDEVVTKAMTEYEGPYYYNCPATVFAALTPLAEGERYAPEWREKVAARLAKAKAAKAVQRGDTVRFATPLRFTRIGERDALIFEKGNLFRTTDGFRVRVPGWRTREWEVAA